MVQERRKEFNVFLLGAAEANLSMTMMFIFLASGERGIKLGQIREKPAQTAFALVPFTLKGIGSVVGPPESN